MSDTTGSNIANAGTPGYKARDIDFGAALAERLGGNDSENAASRATVYRIPTMASLDGNTVEMATEQAAFAENAVAYTATLGFLRKRGQRSEGRRLSRAAANAASTPNNVAACSTKSLRYF